MIELDEHLQRLATSVELPATTPADDLARGRARRRRRDLAVAGAALTTTAVIGTTAVLLSGSASGPGAGPGFAGASPHTSATSKVKAPDAPQKVQGSGSEPVELVLARYRDILREHLDPAGTRIQTGPITNQQSAGDALGTKLDWNGGGMLQVAVGLSLDGVQFFCDGACDRTTLEHATKALVRTSSTRISVAVFQDDGDIVALTADTSFGNNGTSTSTLGLTVEQLLTAAADPRLDLPNGFVQPSGTVGTQ